MRGGDAAGAALLQPRSQRDRRAGLDGRRHRARIRAARPGPSSAISPLQHDLGGFAALAALEQPMRLVVIDNGGGGIFDFLPQAGQVEARPLRAPVHDAGRRSTSSAWRPSSTSLRPDRGRRGPVARSRPATASSPTSGSSARGQRPSSAPAEDRRGTSAVAATQASERASPPAAAAAPPSLISVSASSAAGSEPATMPGARVEVRGAVAEQRRAQGDAELAVLGGVHPAHRARVPAAVDALELGDHRLARARRGARSRPRASGAGGRPAPAPSATRRAGRGSAWPGAGCWRP